MAVSKSCSHKASTAQLRHCRATNTNSNWLQRPSHLSCSSMSRMPRSLTVDGRLGVKPCWLKCSCLLWSYCTCFRQHAAARCHGLADALVRLFFSQLLTSCVPQCNEMRNRTSTPEAATSSCALPLDSLTCCRMVWSFNVWQAVFVKWKLPVFAQTTSGHLQETSWDACLTLLRVVHDVRTDYSAESAKCEKENANKVPYARTSCKQSFFSLRILRIFAKSLKSFV